jgi:uncharacterized membrane protein
LQKTSQENRARARIVVHLLLAAYSIILGYIILGLVFNFNVSADIFFGLSFALLFFTLAQSFYEMGFRNTLIFLAITSVVGFLAEVLGTNSGFPFGKYYYTNFLGEKVLGVPIVVPLVWFVIAYLSFSIARSAIEPALRGKMSRNSVIFRLALLSAFGAVAWDFMIDPMFSAYRYWVWTGQFLPLPELDGIPVSNFIGWFVLVTLMVYICSKVIFTSSLGEMKYRKNIRDSEIAYFLLLLDGLVANLSLKNYAVMGIGSLAMILFLAVSRAGHGKSLAVDSPIPVVR